MVSLVDGYLSAGAVTELALQPEPILFFSHFQSADPASQTICIQSKVEKI